MRLQTPEKVQPLQRKLYLKAKAEPDFRFYLLYDKVYREDILFHAYRLARSNKGAPGVDGQSFEEIEVMGLEGWLSGIRDDLRAKMYRPEPVRRAMVPKPGGGERPLGIPTIRDRVVQGAVKLVTEPILVPPGNTTSPPRVTSRSSVPCRSQTPWCDGWIRMPCRHSAGSTLPRLWPTDSSWGSPLDYGPILLLKPFRFHLAMDTLPSGCLSTVKQLSSSLGCLRRFQFRARLGFRLSTHPGQ